MVLPLVLRNFLLLLIAGGMGGSVFVRLMSTDLMKCSYGERGSLTATCVNASASFFKTTSYRFDHLDETLRCLNCSLQTLDTGTFDISGNQIKILDLSRSLINSIKQRAFVGLIFLERLILANNEIKSIYPGTFTGVKKISYVTLENNSITILSDDGFLELINLQTLNLRNNQIATIAKNAFSGLTNLNSLDLSDNKISEIKGVFDNLTALEVLNLNRNQIRDLYGGDFFNLSSLVEITLVGNMIKSIPASEFAGMPALRKLDLSLNTIDTLIAGSFEGLNLLESLDLSNNNIKTIPQKALQSLHSLRNLNVSNNELFVFQTGQYSGLPQLRVLNLSHNAINGIEVTGIFSLHSLHTLDLANNNISNVDYVGLITRLPRIAYLNLVDNVLPCGLEVKMARYFAEDNFKFVLFKNEVGSMKCVDNPEVWQDNNNNVKDSLKIAGNVTGSAAIIWLSVLVCLTLLLVGVLYYLQFRTYRELRNFNLQRTNSQVRLVSSDLEARDGDYFKE